MKMLKDIEAVLAARTVEAVWAHYEARLAEVGFPHVAYFGVRILKSLGSRRVDDNLFLSSYSPRLLQDILAQDGFFSVPMYRWISSNHGSESWDWMHRRRRAGDLSAEEENMLELFARYGHVSGYAVSLSDSVQQMRAGVIMSGPPGSVQAGIDRLWEQECAAVQALTGLVHLRLSALPFAPPQTVLTIRQREVLEAISIGRTTQEIAGMLQLTPSTIEKHLRLARKALGARTTAQAVLLAVSRRQIFSDPGETCSETMRAAPGEPELTPDQMWKYQTFPIPAPRLTTG